MSLLPATVRDEVLAAADAAGSHRVEVRCSYLRTQSAPDRSPAWPEPGVRIAYLRCNPAPCVELWTVADDALASDWRVA